MKYPSDELRNVFVILIVLSLIYVLVSSNLDVQFYVAHYNTIYLTNIALQIVLCISISYFVYHLFKQIRYNIFGAKITRKLFIVLLVIAVIPTSFSMVIAQYFVKNSVNSWFNVQIDRVLQNSFIISHENIKYFEEELYNKGMIADKYMLDHNNINSNQIHKICAILSVDDIAYYDLNGNNLSHNKNDGFPDVLESNIVSQVKINKFFRAPFFEGIHKSDDLFKVFLLSNNMIIAIQQKPPQFIQSAMHNLDVSDKTYQFLFTNQHKLKNIYSGILSSIVLLSIAIAVLFCIYFSLYIVRPLSKILESTKLISQGILKPSDLDISDNRDELSVLINAFNQMSHSLDAMSKLELEQKNQIMQYKDYLENILDNLTVGVVVFSGQMKLQTANKAFEDILDINVSKINSLSLSEWNLIYPNLNELFSLIVSKKCYGVRNLEFNYRHKITQSDSKNLFIKIINFGVSEDLTIVLISDVTNLMNAKQNEVWADIAKRLAHEIKNPLTPIVLSAERLEMKLTPKLSADDQQFLQRLIGQIILQVEELKKLVNTFRDFASINKPQITKVNLTKLVDETYTLYEQFSHIKLHKSLANNDIIVLGDDSLLRQVLHNLLKNAIDAVAQLTQKSIVISISSDDMYGIIEIKDNGLGFDQTILDNLFEPYRTTKGAKGSGLGLAIVKKIIDEHSGRLNITNDDGARILVYIPLFNKNILKELNYA